MDYRLPIWRLAIRHLLSGMCYQRLAVGQSCVQGPSRIDGSRGELQREMGVARVSDKRIAAGSMKLPHLAHEVASGAVVSDAEA